VGKGGKECARFGESVGVDKRVEEGVVGAYAGVATDEEREVVGCGERSVGHERRAHERRTRGRRAPWTRRRVGNGACAGRGQGVAGGETGRRWRRRWKRASCGRAKAGWVATRSSRWVSTEAPSDEISKAGIKRRRE
jgi:hypothetical protein